MYQRTTTASRRHVRMLNTNWLHISQWFKPTKIKDALGIETVHMIPQITRTMPNAKGEAVQVPHGSIVPGGRGWFVHPRNLTAIDGIEPVVPSIVHDVSPDLPILATPATPSRVGMRVEVQLDWATTVQATIMHEDAARVAIEFDPDYYHAGAWTCDGHVPSGRGWYVPKDSVRAVSEAETQVEAERSEAETQVEAERSEAEALNEVDVAEVWAAYRINPSITIDAWIAARRQLKAAAK